MRRSGSTLAFILIILAVAAGLRIWGLHWGLPTISHFFSYHPDETLVLNAATNVDILSGQFDPGFYNYGSLYIYLVNIGINVAMMAGAIDLSGDLMAHINEFAKVYMTGRIIAVALGILTVYLLYALGRRMYGRRVGLLAAALLAIAPLHAMHSKFMAVDVPATFFLVLSLLYAARIPEDSRWRNYILAGLFAGFAAATKYNAGLVLLSLIAVHLASAQGRPMFQAFQPKLLSGIGSAIAGFLIGCPGALINTQAFVRDFRFEVLHVDTGHGLVFTGTGSGFLYHLMHSLLPGLGPALLVLGILGVLHALFRRSTGNGIARLLLSWRVQTPMSETGARDWMLIVFVAAYYVLIGLAEVRFARYVIPLLPVILLLGARIVVECGERGKAAGVIIGLVAALAIGYTAAYAASLDTLFVRQDTRDQAAAWVKSNTPDGSSIGLPTTPWFYTPPLLPDFGSVDPMDRLASAEESTGYIFAVDGRKEWNAEFFEQAAPDYAILSEFEYVDRKRLHDPDYERYMAVLKRDYRIEKQFVRRPELFGVRFPMQWDLPHDMSYASPDILIFARSVPAGG